MAGESPAAILYDAAGNPVNVILDGGVYKLAVAVSTPAGGAATEVKIRDGAGVRLAGVNNANRLLVDAQISTAGAGAIIAYLEDTTPTNEMAVDGSTTPVVYSWSPGATYDVETSALSLILEDGSIKFGENFMGETTLPNGMLIEIKADDVVYQITNLKRTREVLQDAAPGGFEVIVASPNVVKGYFGVGGLILRKQGTFATDDYVRATVRDDLSKLLHASILMFAKEIQP